MSHARTTDPATSHEAVPRNLSAQATTILWSYYDGEALLDHEAYNLAGMGNARARSQRCSDLRFAGFIERTGERGLTPSGNYGYLCRITPRGKDYLGYQLFGPSEGNDQ